MERCTWVKLLPGMVGDGRPGQAQGYITLAEVAMDKNKAYM